MKKTLLLLCAFVASLTASAQTNLASGKTPVIIKNVTGNTYDSTNDLAWATDGIKDNASKKLNIGGEVSETAVSDNLYIDLGSANRWGSVVITFSGQKPNNYWVYGSTTAPTAETEYVVGTNIPAEWTLIKGGAYGNAGGNDNPYTENIPVASESAFQYFILITDAPTYNSKLDIFEIEVYQYEASVFTTFTATASATTLNPGGTATITTTAKDQFGVDVAATISYQSSDESVVKVENGTVTAVAYGTANVIVTATAGGVTKTETIVFTVETAFDAPATGAKAPTAAIANVLVVYSPTYGYTEKTDNNSGWGGGNGIDTPLFSSSNEETLADNSKAVHVVGKAFNARAKVKDGENWKATEANDFTKAYVALYPKKATSGRIFDDGKYNTGITFSGLTPGQWNYVQVNVGLTTNFILVALDDETEFYVSEFYLTKPAAGELEVTVTGSKAKVVGPVTTTNVSTVVSEAGKAAVIDLTGATISDAITITPSNTNAIVVVTGDTRTSSQDVTAGNGNLVVYSGGYYRAASGKKITITDSDADQPDYGVTIDAKDDGYEISRTVGAGYATVCLPVDVTLPDGVKAYSLSGANSTNVTFDEITGTTLTANTPYVVYSASGFSLTTGEQKNDLNLTATAGTATAGGVTMTGTLQSIDGSATIWALHSGKISKFTNGKIGAFRAYFTNVSGSAPLQAIFRDGDGTTGIGSIEADGTVRVMDGAVYNLAGQRVQNPQKGLYIVNGKKVIIK